MAMPSMTGATRDAEIEVERAACHNSTCHENLHGQTGAGYGG